MRAHARGPASRRGVAAGGRALPGRLLGRQPGAVRVPHPHPRRWRAAGERHRDALRPRRQGSGDARVPGRHREPEGRGGAAQCRGATALGGGQRPGGVVRDRRTRDVHALRRTGARGTRAPSRAGGGLFGVRALRTAPADPRQFPPRHGRRVVHGSRRRGRPELRDLVCAHARARWAPAGRDRRLERRQPAAAPRGPAPPGAEDGGDRAARGRSRARLQQPPGRDHGPRRAAAAPARAQPAAASPRRSDPESGGTRRPAHPPTARLQPQGGGWRRVCSTFTWWWPRWRKCCAG